MARSRPALVAPLNIMDELGEAEEEEEEEESEEDRRTSEERKAAYQLL